jgi:hypothetical protein
MNKTQFVRLVVTIAHEHGWRIETNKSGLTQIDFGNKKLHTGHLEAMFPEILEHGLSIPAVIDRVAPGRPCTHKPMRLIIAEVKKREQFADMARAS